MSSDASSGTDSDTVGKDGFSFDSANRKYRQFKAGDSILEYTIDAGEITIDWVFGRNALAMIQRVVDREGSDVRRISGYVTDKLGAMPDKVLQRIATGLARRLGGDWTATMKRIEGRRYLVLTR
jgi:hypothetical protein